MSFFHPIYIDNNNDNNNNNDDNPGGPVVKKNKFENCDLESLDSLIYTNEFIKSIVNKFHPYKWKNKYTNILKLDVVYTIKNDTTNNNIFNNNNNICFDSLYINKNNINNEDDNDDIDIRLIYVTPHIIFYNFIKGYSTTDIINMKIIQNIENICVIPKFNYRSHDNKSVEFISDDDNRLMSHNYVTLKSFCDYYCNNNNYKYPVEKFKKFSKRVFEILLDTNFIPYFIHPNRLILYKDETLRIVSPNILQYIYSPYSPPKKIQHVLFSHPRVLLNVTSKSENFLEKMTRDTVDLFLDFFHSSFVTSLWIYNNNNNNIHMSLTRNINNIFNDVSSVIKNNKRKRKNVQKSIINNKTFEQINFLNLYHDDDDDGDSDHDENNKLINPCRNIYGFCLNYYHHDINLRKLIHNYGCEHLQKIMPIVLDNAVKEATNKNQPKIFMSTIQLQFEIFIRFLEELKNIKGNGGIDGNT